MAQSTRLQPLKGINILSLCLNLPGPAAVLRLQSMGARCLKIEPPLRADGSGSDPMQLYCPRLYDTLHPGIRVQSLNLKDAADQTRLAAHLSTADVLITSFRPSALRKLGLGWQRLHRLYPKLSMVRIVGGPAELAEHAGHDLTYLASQQLVDSLEMPATLYADMTASLMATEAVLQLVLQQQRTGKSACMDVPISDAAAHLALPRRHQLTGPNTLLGGSHAAYRIYPCADGRVALAALEPHFAQALIALVGLPWRGMKMLLELAVRKAIAAFLARHNCAELGQLALDHDLPLHPMPD
jgi:alpha-methylacyl-CoA racemase